MAQQLAKPKVGGHELKFKWGMLIGLAELLPRFNPEWSSEEKDRWHESFLAILSAGISLCHSQDDLELYERDRKDQLSPRGRQFGDYRE